MKRKKIILAIVVVALLGTACSARKDLDQILDKSTGLIKAGEYDQALEILRQAQEDSYKDRDGELKAMIEAVENYQEAQEKFNLGDYRAGEESLGLLDQKAIDLIGAEKIEDLRASLRSASDQEDTDPSSGAEKGAGPGEAKDQPRPGSLKKLEEEVSPYLKIFTMDKEGLYKNYGQPLVVDSFEGSTYYSYEDFTAYIYFDDSDELVDMISKTGSLGANSREELIEKYGQPIDELNWIDNDSGQSEFSLEYRIKNRTVRFTNPGGQHPYLEIE